MNNIYLRHAYPNELYHYGVSGQKWKVRRYQNKDKTLTKEGSQHYHELYISKIQANAKQYSNQALENARKQREAERKAKEQRWKEYREFGAPLDNWMKQTVSEYWNSRKASGSGFKKAAKDSVKSLVNTVLNFGYSVKEAVKRVKKNMRNLHKLIETAVGHEIKL